MTNAPIDSMSEACPNCRARGGFDGSFCRYCRWQPLRTTEMVFVNAESIVCPQCGNQRRVADGPCEHCGAVERLEPPAEIGRHFHISTLLFVTSLAGVCLALARVAPFLGFAVAGISTVACYRTMLLARHRRRFRYSVSGAELATWFFMTTVSLGIGVVCVIAMTFMFAAFIQWVSFDYSTAPFPSPVFSLTMLSVVALSLGGTVLLVRKNWQSVGSGTSRDSVAKPGERRMLWHSFLWGASIGIACLSTGVWILWEHWSVLLTMATPCLAMMWIHRVPERSRAARCWCVGFVSGPSVFLWGVMACFSLNGWLIPMEGIGIAFLLGCGMPPFLLVVAVGQKIWRWDDAFPNTSPLRQADQSLPDGGIVFVDSGGESQDARQEEERARPPDPLDQSEDGIVILGDPHSSKD